MTLCTDPDRDGLFVRGAEFADCAALAAVQVGCFADEPWSPATFATLLDCPGTFGLVASTDAAGEAGRVAAFILCRTVADEGEVLSFGVAAVQRRQGWGSRLLCEAVMLLHLAGAATVFLEVAEDNLPALALYRGFGFVQVGRRKEYYRREHGAADALVLSLALRPVPY